MLQFRAVSIVADPASTVRAVAIERGKSAWERVRITTTGLATGGEGGLLTQSLLEEGMEESSHLANRRFTQVGRRRPKSVFTDINHVSVYKLKFLAQRCLGSAVNEPVFFMLPFQ